MEDAANRRDVQTACRNVRRHQDAGRAAVAAHARLSLGAEAVERLETLPLLHFGVELVDRQPELGEGGVQAAHAGDCVDEDKGSPWG